jgi:prepilin signal peptidase PulO-like enzyme (type II secretory pathway)
MQLAFGAFLLLEKSTHILTVQILLGDLVAGICVGLPLWLIYKLSKERAMGEGDGILAFLIGFGLGLERGFLALYISFVSGAVVGILLLIMRKKGIKSAVPFGPFILFGAGVVSVYGPVLLAVVRSLYSW